MPLSLLTTVIGPSPCRRPNVPNEPRAAATGSHGQLGASAPFGCWTALSGFPKFLPHDSSDRVGVDAVARSSQVLAKGVIDHRLVPAAGGVGPLAEGLEHVVVDVDRDPRLSALTDDRTPFALAEVVFLFHIGVSRSASP